MRALASDFERYRQTLLEIEEGEGWNSELRRYLNDRPVDVTKDTNNVKWWQVSQLESFLMNLLSNSTSGPRCAVPDSRADSP